MDPPGWGFGSGWYLVRLWVGQMYPPDEASGQNDIWSDGWLQANGSWLAGWPPDKMSLVYWCKRWTLPRSDLGSGWQFVRWLVGWLVAGGCLAGHLTKCQSDPPTRIWLWVRLTFCHMAGWLANCSWLAGHLKKMSLVYWCKRWTPPRPDLGSGGTFCQVACWLAKCNWLAGWLVISQNVNLTSPKDLILG